MVMLGQHTGRAQLNSGQLQCFGLEQSALAVAAIISIAECSVGTLARIQSTNRPLRMNALCDIDFDQPESFVRGVIEAMSSASLDDLHLAVLELQVEAIHTVFAFKLAVSQRNEHVVMAMTVQR